MARHSTSSSRHEEEEEYPRDYEHRTDPSTNLDEEEKAIELSNTRSGDASGRGGASRGKGQSKSRDRRSLRSTRSHQSRAGGDGYTWFDAEPDNARPNKSTPGATEQPYLVAWDGDMDPLNPRSMSKLRRWAIVLICSASSLCV